MPRKSRLKLPPLDLDPETTGARIARRRKAKGLTQTQLAEQMGLVQALVSAYERDSLRLSADMAVRFAQTLGVSTDELLGLKRARRTNGELPLKLSRRLQGIERLPAARQKALLQTIDLFLKGAER
jgi:transcriptional regulator with XRE-family HTH domain